MALVKISQLPATATLSRAQEIPTNNAGVNEKITISQVIDANAYSISADYNGSLTDAYTHIYFNHSSSTKLIQYNCPNCASSDGRLIILQNLAAGVSYINGNGANIEFKGSSLSTVKLFNAGDKIGIRSDGSSWQIEFYHVEMITNFINRSDWGSVQMGAAFTYDNKSASVDLIGQHITLDSGNTAIVSYDSGGTGATGILYCYNWTGDGLGVNNEEGTCGSGGYTFDVDEGSGSSKDIDYVIYHELGITPEQMNIKYWISSDGTWANAAFLLEASSAAATNRAIGIIYEDDDSFSIIGEANGILWLPGYTLYSIQSNDYYINIIWEINI
jgi:hypothetical protein